jgi:hypothetical protein
MILLRYQSGDAILELWPLPERRLNLVRVLQAVLGMNHQLRLAGQGFSQGVALSGHIPEWDVFNALLKAGRPRKADAVIVFSGQIGCPRLPLLSLADQSRIPCLATSEPSDRRGGAVLRAAHYRASVLFLIRHPSAVDVAHGMGRSFTRRSALSLRRSTRHDRLTFQGLCCSIGISASASPLAWHFQYCRPDASPFGFRLAMETEKKARSSSHGVAAVCLTLEVSPRRCSQAATCTQRSAKPAQHRITACWRSS